MACVLDYLALNKGLEIKSLADITLWSAVIIRAALFVWEIALARPANLFIALFALSTAFGLAAIFTSGAIAIDSAVISFLATFASQLIERRFFFTNSTAPRMPGMAAQ